MKITLNGVEAEVVAEALDAALVELGYAGATIATAVNGDFVPADTRAEIRLAEGDCVEVVAPLKGG